jgi:hypothetical protein
MRGVSGNGAKENERGRRNEYAREEYRIGYDEDERGRRSPPLLGPRMDLRVGTRMASENKRPSHEVIVGTYVNRFVQEISILTRRPDHGATFFPST